jgi:hypothetical protein
MAQQKSVVNLSNLDLSSDQISLLERGLKFCPTPKTQKVGDLRDDMDRLHKRLRQIAFFESPENNLNLTLPTQIAIGSNLQSLDPFKHRKFKPPAPGKGPPGPQNLEAMISVNEHQFNARPRFNNSFRENLSPSERAALAALVNNDDIIIKPADKGSAVVIMDRIDYLKEGYKQLGNDRFYKKLDHNPTEKHRVEVQNMVEDMYQNGEIDETVKNYLTDITCRTSELYLLPKIHKGVTPPPGRPIISANGCPTEKISQFVDHFLNPTTTSLKSYIKDTTDFLLKLEKVKNLPPDCLLVTLDITSLYTNIPNDDGLRAAKETLDRTRPGPGLQPKNDSLIDLLELVLKRNNFQFNGHNYQQIGGTAMGTKAAVGYANNTMGDFENKHVYTYHTQPIVYYRFIDDIFIIWTHGREALDLFIDHLNSRSATIKFTSEISQTKVTFLDTLVTIEDDQLVTNLYCKPTDSHNYLRYNSAHPQRCKDSIPFSQFLRIRRICSKISDFDIHVVMFCRHFIRRGYPVQLLQDAAIMAREKDRTDILHNKAKEDAYDNEKVFLTTTYHPHDTTLKDLIFKNWEMLGKSTTTNFIHEKRLMCGYRRAKNLRDLLVKAKVPHKQGDELADPNHVPTVAATTNINMAPPPKRGILRQASITNFFTASTRAPTGPSPSCSLTSLPITNTMHIGERTTNKTRGYNYCSRKECRYCPLLNKTGKIRCQFTGLEHPCMQNISCRSSNLVYAITCKRCGMQYVGQTMLRLKDRFVHHLRDIEMGLVEKSVSKHFSTNNHTGYKDMTISVLEFIKKPPRSPQSIGIRLRVERHWTHVLRSLAPIGLNIENPKEYKSHKKTN